LRRGLVRSGLIVDRRISLHFYSNVPSASLKNRRNFAYRPFQNREFAASLHCLWSPGVAYRLRTWRMHH
jgi:hypothetical protein